MGRFSSAGSTFGVGSGVFNVLAGEAIAQNDAVELGPNGKAYKVKVTDYAAVPNFTPGVTQNSTANGQIVAQTQIVNGQALAFSRQAVVQGPDGSIFTFTPQNNTAASTGFRVSKYSAAGALVAQYDFPTGSETIQNHHLLLMPNGNLVALGTSTTGYVLYYMVFDYNLGLVKNFASIEAQATGSPVFSAVALSGGGFAVVYQQNANPLLSRLATFDNSGAAVLAPTTIWTRTGTSGTQYHKMVQLSNGNLAIAVDSGNSAGTIGLYYGIVTTSGVSVLAFTQLNANFTGQSPDVSMLAGFFAVARPISTANGMQAWVFNNSGVLQGAPLSTGSIPATSSTYYRLLSDGSAFWLIYGRVSDSKQVLTKIPVTGTGFVTTAITTTGLSNYNIPFDAFYENGFIVGFFIPNQGQYLFVVSTDTGNLVANAATSFGAAAATTGGSYPAIIPGGDFSFIACYDQSNTAGTFFAVGKYANMSVAGVAQAGVAAGSLAPVAAIAGGYASNFIKGSPAKAFDHNAANIPGNKGALLNYGVVLKGY